MDKRFLFLMIAMMLILPSVSAFEFDNVKSYDATAREVTITNSFGMGDVIGKARLKSPINVVVGEGYQKVAEFDIWAYQDYSNALKQFTFEDLKNNKAKINREYDLKFKSFENVTVDDYKCNNSATVHDNCWKVGSHVVQKEVWNKITPADLKKNERLTIGVFTVVQRGDYVDWKPVIYGVEVPEWSSWTQSLNANLNLYYDCNSSDELVSHSLNFTNNEGSMNYTTNGAKIGKSCRFTANNNLNLSNSSLTNIRASEGTANFWMAVDDVVTAEDYLWSNAQNFDANQVLHNSNYLYSTGFTTSTHTSGGTFTNGQWYMITYLHNSTGSYIYRNGVIMYSGTPTALTVNNPYKFGTNSANGNDLVGYLDEISFWSRALSDAEIQQLYNGGTGLTYVSSFDTAPSITLNSPANFSSTTSPQTIQINFTASDNWNLTDVKLYVNGVLNQTNASGFNNSVYLFNITVGDGSWTVYGTATDNSSTSTNSSARLFQIHSTVPQITINSLPNISTTSLPVNQTFNVTNFDVLLDKCWYDNGGTNTTYSCTNNTATVGNISYATGGTKTLTFWANDTFGITNHSTASFNIYDFANTQGGSSTGADGTSTTFTLVVNSTSFPIGDADASLWYNGANYIATSKTVNSANAITFSKTLIIPNGTGNSTGKNVSWFWNYNATQLTTRNSTLQNQTIYSVSITDCALTTGTVILNMSLKDEGENTLVNVTAPNEANIEVDLIIRSPVNSSLEWTFSKKWVNNQTVAVCVPNGLLNYSSYDVEFIVGYDSTLHVREFFYLENGTLDNSTQFNDNTLKVLDLMDLASADSTTFLFAFTDADNQEVDDIIVHTFRKYIGEGVFREVERSKQDNAGQTHVHLVEEDVIYYFMITQYGIPIFTSDTYNAKCLSTPCEISLSASATETNWSIIDNEGGLYATSSNRSTRITTTTFNLESLDLVNVSLYKFTNGSSVLLNSSSLTATAGSIDLPVPLAYGNTTFFVTISRNGTFIKSEWVDLSENGRDYFGTFGALLGGIIVLALILMSVTEGAGMIIFTALALIIIGVMQLVDLGWMALISIICAGGIIVWKLVSRRNKQG